MPEFSDACKVVCEKFKIKSFNHHQKQAFIALVGEKKDVFVNLPTGVFARKFLTFYKLLYNWLSCNNSSTLIGHSYTMGMACPALFSRRLWGGRMRPTQKTIAKRLSCISFSGLGAQTTGSIFFCVLRKPSLPISCPQN